LLRAEKLLKKAKKADLFAAGKSSKRKFSKANLAKGLFELAAFAQARGWSAEELLCEEVKKAERRLRRREKT
jgi:hypothetical protein